MDDKTKRNFYRHCKEEIDFYLSTHSKDELACFYRLLGDPAANKFVNFEGDMAKDFLQHLRLYFANKMNSL